MSSNDVNGPYGPAGGRGADDYTGGKGRYPEPEGWGDDGFWRDQSIDSDYETGLNSAVRPDRGRAPGDGSYSYWADGKGWESAPGGDAHGDPGGGSATRADQFATRADPSATRADPFATRAQYGAGFGAGGADGTGGDATAFYGAGPGAAGGGRGGPGGPRRPGGPGGHGRRPGKFKGSWWRHWTWKKALGVAGGMFGMFVLVLAGTYFYLYSTTQIPTTLAANVLDQNSTVYYSDGKTVIGTIGPFDRQILTFSQIPKTVQDAVLAAEDRSFWTEGGISPTGIIRAAYDDLTSSGGNLSGGSTITQEFVRHYYMNIGTQQTISRKVKEVFVAMKLAKAESKQWILTHFLNTIFLGNNSYGIAAASQTYFGVPVAKLTVAQAAVIAAIIQQPSTYPLPQYRSDLIARWRNYVLNGMVQMGDITAAQAASMKFPKLLTDAGTNANAQAYGTTNSSDPWAPYIMNVVYNELTGIDHISTSELETGGLKIVTTISRPLEVGLYGAVNQNIKLIKQEGYTLPSYALIGAELQNPHTGAIVAMYPGRGQNMSKAQCQKYDCDLNTAVYAREQVGSSFKPYVLSAAVNEGMNVQNSILDTSPYMCVAPDGSSEYSLPISAAAYAADEASKSCALTGGYTVENDAGEIIGTKLGTATSGANAGAVYYSDGVQDALAQSSNTGFTDLAHRVGTRNIVNMAAAMGVNVGPYSQGGSDLDTPHFLGQVGMALGIAPLTVNEQTTMLSTIDNGGVYHSAHIIQSYQLPDQAPVPGVVTQHIVLSQNLDSQVQYAMEKTTVDGTATAASLGPDRPIIGKTGTTSNAKAAFFIGAIPQWSFVVGIFTESQDPNSPQTLTALGGGGFGGSWPATIWHTFMSQEFDNLPVEQFLNPVFTGSKWNLVGNPPAKKKKQPKKRGPTPPIPTFPGRGHGRGGGGPFPTLAPLPTSTALPTTGPGPSASASASPSVSPSAGPSSSSPPGKLSGGGTTTGNGALAGLAFGGMLSVLPGSLLWARASSRRRRRRRRSGMIR